METLKREIRFRPAWDKRNPDPKKNYGIHGVDIAFFLKGEKGAIQFVFYTNWQLPHVQKENDSKPLNEFPYMFHKPMATDVGYHSPKPMYEGQTKMSGKCDIIGGDCYYDGSSLYAETMFDILVEKGDEAVWQKLEEEYAERFDKKHKPEKIKA